MYEKHKVKIGDGKSARNKLESTIELISTILKKDLEKFKAFKFNETLKIKFIKPGKDHKNTLF